MIARDALTTYLHDHLACDRYTDYAPNGLQVEGRIDIKRICTAVTASYDVIIEAIAWHADALLVHHGYFWRGEEAVITGMKRRRIGQLLTHDLNLYAYHLPLDCHADLGNNACLGQLFALQNIQAHPVGHTPALLWSGQLAHPMSACAFSDDLSKKLQREPLCISGTEKPIQRVAWCSGGAQDYIVDAHRLGVDAYISGEISERTYYQAQELGLHYFACGHHATERLGIQALGKHLLERFDVQHRFIDSNNPV
ncbi:MAG TPA: Nif3-like dinuclear metal center hexameric protein [Legionella sp.]|nr:Nif3-like dinuclear metal center hexameric protein [Legionella sp.]